MPENKLNNKINVLFQRKDWEAARRILEREREKNANDHWVITQLGVTFYEDERYEEALQLFLASQNIVPDCPLTLWNLAGTLDSLGNHSGALQVYTWLLRAKTSPDDDPCWESREWADALKTDCVFRVGVCFQHMGRKRKAEECYRQYVDLLSIGVEGSYSIEDVKRQIRVLQGAERASAVQNEVRKAVNLTLQASGIGPPRGTQKRLPGLDIRDLAAGDVAASKG